MSKKIKDIVDLSIRKMNGLEDSYIWIGHTASCKGNTMVWLNYTFCYMVEGWCVTLRNGEEYRCKSGEFVIYNPGDISYVLETSDYGKYVFFEFSEKDLKKLIPDIRYFNNATGTLNSVQAKNLKNIFSSIFNEQVDDKSILIRFLNILKEVSNFDNSSEKIKKNDEFLKLVSDYLLKTPTELMNLSDLQKMTDFTKFHLIRKIKSISGCTPNKLFNAKKSSLTRIAILNDINNYDLYFDQSHLVKQFKSYHYNQVPSKIKNIAKKAPDWLLLHIS